MTAISSPGWRYVALFNNVTIEESVGNEYIALVPPFDPRIDSQGRDGALQTFVGRFRDQFGRKVIPSVLILREDVNPDLDSIVGFRNAVSVTAVAQAWMRFLSHGAQAQYFKFSDYFSLYPHMLAKDGQNVLVHSPALLGLDELTSFQGQTNPGISRAHAPRDFCDTYLLVALLDRWVDRYICGDKRWSNIALFRSLQMAFRASAMPFQNHATFEDYGAQLSLWVSAHEILTRPETGTASLSEVLKNLANAQLARARLRAKRYTAQIGKKRTRVPLLQKLYCEMYRSRNHFLHGNPVTLKDVFPGGKMERYSLVSFAPIVYRFALYEFLQLWKQDVCSPEMTTERVRRAFYEDAVLAATVPAQARHTSKRRRRT